MAFRDRMKEGNAFLTRIKTEGAPDVLKSSWTQDAIRCYNQALNAASTIDERASVHKNLAKASGYMVNMSFNDEAARKWYLVEGLSLCSKALEDGARAKSAEWMEDMRGFVIVLTTFFSENAFELSSGPLFSMACTVTTHIAVRLPLAISLIEVALRSALRKTLAEDYSSIARLLEKYEALMCSCASWCEGSADPSATMLHKRCQTLFSDFYGMLRGVRASQKLHSGRVAMLRVTTEDAADYFQNVDIAIDFLEGAIHVTQGKDLFLEAQASSLMGKCFAKFLSMESAALKRYTHCIMCAMAVSGGTFINTPWYREAQHFVEVHQQREVEKDARAKEARRKRLIDKIQVELDLVDESNTMPETLIHFLAKTYSSPSLGTDGKVTKSLYLRIIAHFHPDKHANAPEERQLLFEEITKRLTLHYEQTKG